MNAFEFHSVGRIVFGIDQASRLAELAKPLGSRALLVTNAGQVGDGGVIDRIGSLLSAGGLSCEVVRQRGEPTVEDIDHGVTVARGANCDLVIGLGGGSAIDAAKAIAGMMTNEGSVLDYLEVIGSGKRMGCPALPWIALPTTAGTGAEATRNAVIGSPQHRRKASLRSSHLLARIALIDPRLGLLVPPDVTARCGMDAMCQLIESYTSTQANPLTSALALDGIRLATKWLATAYADGGNIEGRTNMAMAALLSGIALTNAGLGAAHGLAGPLGGVCSAPHGTICAALLPHVMQANVDALRARSAESPTLRRYADIGRALTGRDEFADPAAIDAGIDFVYRLARELCMPRLRQFHLVDADIQAVVTQAERSSSMKYNPVTLGGDVLTDILGKAM
jgi:alcohol dehydrogenase class IV